MKNRKRHYSPLRYPGGKACLSDLLCEFIKKSKLQNCTYVEPYAGGSGAALKMLMLEKVDNIIINDLDRAIYSFWKSIINNTDKFIEKINTTKITIKEWRKQRQIYKNPKSKRFELGFATFFLNRTNRSGIIEGGPIGGIKQSNNWKIDARFNKEDLIDRIKNIASYKSRIKVTQKDGIELLKEINKTKNHFVYIDPPYFEKGSCLYLNHFQDEDHTKLAKFLNQKNNFSWILTYDYVDEIKNLYKQKRSYDFSLSYHVDVPRRGKELLVLSDKIKLV
jgi:DNA adenine methylase